MNHLQFSADDFAKFIERYNLAVDNNEQSFEFNGYEFVTRYAYYLIQYIIDQLSEASKDDLLNIDKIHQN